MKTTSMLTFAAAIVVAAAFPASAQEKGTTPPTAPAATTATAAPTLEVLFREAGWIEKDDTVVGVNGQPYTRETDAAVYAKVKDDTKFSIEVDRAGKGRTTITGDTTPPKTDASNEDPTSPGEMEEMSKDLRLTPLQTAAVRNAIIRGQHDFEQRLIEASNSGARDIEAIEKIGQEVSRRAQERISRILFPEQRASFDMFMEKAKAESEEPPTPGERPPPAAPPGPPPGK
jgi:hypothetical protein